MHSHWELNIAETFVALKSGPQGLAESQTAGLLKKYGPNTPPHLQMINPLIIFLRQFKNILIIILICISLFSFFNQEYLNGTILAVMLLVNAGIGFIQEFKAAKSLEKLRNLISFTTKVIRDGKELEINSKGLLPGDIVLLNMGNIVPADIKLLSTNNLLINESALTGESLPVEKNADDVTTTSLIPQDIHNGIFMGTSVVSGSARGVVVATGKNTLLCRTVEVTKDNEMPTNFQKVLNQFSNMLLYLVAALTAFVFFSNVLLGRDPLQSFMLGITVALGITPEVMPIIISISISAASLKLAKLGVLIRRLSSMEDLGNMDMLCTDKTGTITNGILQLTSHLNLELKPSHEALLYSLICNANHPTVTDRIFPNPIDKEIWENADSQKLKAEINAYKVIYCEDFSFETRVMAVVAQKDGQYLTILKGATENILERSTKVMVNGKAEILTKQIKLQILNSMAEFEQQGNRVIAVGILNDGYNTRIAVSGYTFMGYLLFRDNPKDSFDETIQQLEALNVQLKIITGDSPIVTRAICKEAGLDISEAETIIGAELAKFDAAELIHKVESYRIFARVSPEQKSAIIKALRTNGHVVGYIGDGINDIGALKLADVGISVDSAVDVTKDASDIVLLKRNLSVLAQGIIEGRKTFDNTIKFILNTMSSSFGNVITIAILSLFLKFIPLLPIQILLIDSLSDIQHLTISTDNVDKEQLGKPQKWNMHGFLKFMLYFGLLSIVVDLIHVYVFQSLSISPDLFRTAWFVESILTELLATFIIRTRLPFFKSKASKPLIITSLVAIFIGMTLPMIQLGVSFGFVGYSLPILGIIILLVLFYLAILEIAKLFFYKKII